MNSASKQAQVITFYSYKGGVGRSMAVANTAALLAQEGERVLVIDFDLEAPGLHRYFVPPKSTIRGMTTASSSAAKAGTIELFHNIEERLRRQFPDPEVLDDAATEDTARAFTAAAIAELLDSNRYCYDLSLKDPSRPNHDPHVTFMPAGYFDEGYPERVRGFNWRAVYQDFPFLFSSLREVLGQRYSYVLIDSRTGITDVGGVCTALLPTKLVLVFSLNEQSLFGALQIGEQATRFRAGLDGAAPMPIFPLPSRVENAENDLTRTWIADVRRRFETLFEKLYGAERADLKEYFERVRIPHKTYFAFGEKIAAEIEPATESQSLTEAFSHFVTRLKGAGARAEHREPLTRTPAPRVDPGRDAMLLISIGGDSLRPTVDAVRASLGLANVPESSILEISSPRFVEPNVADWTRLAEAVRDQVRPWVNNQYDRIHLFYKGPVVIAPLLGALIVPSKPLKIYYFENGRYDLAYTCDRRLVRS